MLTTNDSQEQMKNARLNGTYDKIWQSTGKCVFCDLKDKYIIHKENGIALTINLFPYIDGQLMAIPLRHVASPKELTEEEWSTLRKFSYLAKKLIKDVHKVSGMWSLIREGGELAQMSVTKHLHMHFIPIDKSDLCVWNYRELKNTPIENTQLYLNQIKEFIKDYKKFNKKYFATQSLPIVVDLVIINQNKEICFQERIDKYKFNPDILTLPGGHVDDFNNDLKVELAKEIKEELTYNLDISKINLLDSRISELNFPVEFKDDIKEHDSKKFLWNTYLLKDFKDDSNLKAADDCKEILWLNYSQVKTSNRISQSVKDLVLPLIK